MAADEAKVTYRAIAHFLSLKKAAAQARKDLQSIQTQEAKTNAASVAGSQKVAVAHRNATKALRSRTTSTKTATLATLALNRALRENNTLLKSNGSAAQVAAAKVKTASSTVKDATTAYVGNSKAMKTNESASTAAAAASAKLGESIKKTAEKARSGESPFVRLRRRFAELNKQQIAFRRNNGGVVGGLTKINTAMRRIGNYRPRLIPPFVALIPLIAGVLALINPLVAALGALGAVGFSAGSSLLSLGGAALAIVPMLTAAISAVTALVVAFKGIGGVFSKYKAARDAVGGGGGSGNVDSYEKRLREATEGLSDAQQDAIWAQEDLNEARKEAVKRLEDLRKAVARASTDEADAAANLQLATENYYNVLADPGSTLGEKMKALADLNQAQQDLVDTRDDAISNADELAKAEADGIENDRQVLQAKRRVREAIEAEADAYEKLQKVLNGTDVAGGGGGAVDEFQKALDALSPSARAVVLALIAMGDAWKAVQQAVQEAFFSKIVDDMDDLASLIPVVGRLLVKAAGAMGRFAHNFLMMVSSPEWKSDFDLIGDQNVKLIDLAGEGLLTLLTILKDLTIAVGPFAAKFMAGLNGGLAALSGIVANARETGSLAAWLDTIYERLQQWWRIVRNVAQTLFNYGAASSDFGKWITDGLEEMTEGWKAASEEARKEGSPFQTWLENTKPLLEEIKGLFGDFFGWLSDTAMDDDNISEATEIVAGLRRLGDEIRGVIDTFNELKLGSDFVDTLTAIVKSINEILANGGAEGFKTFFDVIKGFFEWVAEMFKDPFWGPFVTTLLQFAGAMAALSFIGKFTGLTTLFGWLIKLSKNTKVMTLLTRLGGLKTLGGVTAGVAAVGAYAEAGATNLGGVANAAEQYKADPTRENFVNLQGQQTATVAQASVPILSVIQGFLDVFFPEIGAGFRQFFVEAASGFQGWVLGLGEGFAETWANFGEGFNGFLSGIGTWFDSNIREPFNNFFLVTLPNAWLGLVSWVSTNIFTPIGTFFTITLPNFVMTVFGTIGAWIQTYILTPLSTFFTVTLPTFFATLGVTIATGFATAASNVGSWFYNTIQSVGSWFWTAIQNIAGWFGVAIERAGRGFATGPKGGQNGGLIPGQYMATGGRVRDIKSGVMRPRGKDTTHIMAQPGEYMIRKPIVDFVGVDNLDAFNNGLMSFGQLMQSKNKGKENTSGVGYFDGGGLISGSRTPPVYSASSAKFSQSAGTMIDNSQHFGDINIMYPKRERSSESLPTALRKVSYVGGRRKPEPRLGVGNDDE